ncbi:MAG: DUF4093 domain-containing protein [Ruminococcus sp.]|nr:DUF4093 domain-containing protein [Ruminococcus sp.]
MIALREAVIVEGRYDKIKLSGIIDAPIIETNGFRVFNDKEKQHLIRQIAAVRGILIFTDSDGAGLVIRNFLKGAIPPEQVKHCYIPQLKGKEKRKARAGKEGLLGVEGVTDEVILSAIRRSGATILGEKPSARREMTKADLYGLGLTGTENAARLRQVLLQRLGMPTYLSANAMLTALNCLYSFEELKIVSDDIKTCL